MTVGQILFLSAHKAPGRVALVDGKERFTFQEFNARVNRFARALLQMGLQKGEKVAALLYNSHPLVEVFWGTVKAGGVFTPINFRLAPPEVAYILDHSDARFFVFGAEFAESVSSLLPGIKKVQFHIAVGPSPALKSYDYEALLKDAPMGEPDLHLSEADGCQLLYTSGTTGRPKGALLTHENLLWNLMNTILGREEQEGEISLVVGPLYHAAALNNHFMVRVALPGTSILLKHFDARRVMEIIEEEKVTVISGAPAMYHLLLYLPGLEKFDTRSVTKCTSGAASLPDETRRRMQQLFPNAQGIYDVYGCTEASPNIAILKAKDSLRKRECVGPPVPFLEVKIIDEQGRQVPAGTVGELICRGANVMREYYKDEPATQKALKGGWLHTGDLARLDEEGFIYIVDRKKDMVISGGENIYPREIEEVLFQNPKIRDAAVIGVPDPLWGESVKAFIVLKEDAAMTEEEVIEYCKRNLASYKKPRIVKFVGSLPRNPSGKVLKTKLREEP